MPLISSARVHIDSAGCAWLIRRFIDPAAEFSFVTDPTQVPSGATAFDMRGVALSHHHGCCTFETALTQYELTADPVLEEIGRIVHEADLGDEQFDAPVAASLDILIRGLSPTSGSDEATLAVTDRLFDGLYEHTRRRAAHRPGAGPESRRRTQGWTRSGFCHCGEACTCRQHAARSADSASFRAPSSASQCTCLVGADACTARS